MIKPIFTAIALSFLASSAKAQEKYLSGKGEMEQLSRRASELFRDNKISESVKELTPYWPIPENEVEEFREKTIKYLNLINERYGNSMGIVKIKEETIADIGIRETYLVRFKITALRLKFTYYKSDKGWILNSFKWDDSFTEEFK